MVLSDGMTDFIGTVDEAIDNYQSAVSTLIEGRKLLTDAIIYRKSFVNITEILINNTPYNNTSLTPGQKSI